MTECNPAHYGPQIAPVGFGESSLPPPKDELPLGLLLGAVGDSITAIGGLAHSLRTGILAATLPDIYQGCYYAYTHIVPPTGGSEGGGMIPAGKDAATGATIQDVIDTYVPAQLARTPKPNMTAVLAGFNNLAWMGDPVYLAARIIDMRIIYEMLIANDVLPIACGLITSDGVAYRTRIQAFNAELEILATALGIPYVNFFDVTDNGVNGWLPGYCDDTVHPTSLAAKAMGVALRDVLDPLLGTPEELVTAANEAGDLSLIWTNGRMILDTDADGDPDGGQVPTVDAWRRFSGAGDCTFSLVAEAGVVDGNWWRINKTANTVSTQLYTQTPACPVVTPGNTIAYGFKCKVMGADQTTRMDVWATKVGDNTVVPFRVVLDDLRADLDPFVFYIEKVVPAGMTAVRLWIEIQNGLADFYIGQLTIRDLG